MRMNKAETNNIMAAQKVILEELENQVGGTARNMAKTTIGALTQMKNALGDVGESIGSALAPGVSALADKLGESEEVEFEDVDKDTGEVKKDKGKNPPPKKVADKKPVKPKPEPEPEEEGGNCVPEGETEGGYDA